MLDRRQAEPIARMILDRIREEYPHHHGHVVESAADLGTPRAIHPAFYGCFDWHSAVHSHWALARILHRVPEVESAEEIQGVLDSHLTPGNITAEIEVFSRSINRHYERPYGWAWLLTLHGELLSSPREEARAWSEAVAPLAELFERRLIDHLRTLAIPERAGTHRNTAYSLELALDYARTADRRELEATVITRARDFYAADRDWPFRYEPSGTDFLSPGLAEADLMRRTLAPEELHRWLIGFFPEGRPPDLAPVIVHDRRDPLEGHLIGLAFHRAIAILGIAAALPIDHPFRDELRHTAEEHRMIGLSQIENTGWGGEHWLGSFAVYLLTDAGREAGNN